MRQRLYLSGIRQCSKSGTQKINDENIILGRCVLMELVKKNTWVEVKNIILDPENRSNQLPNDTKKVPYEMKVRGFLANDAYINETVNIKTLSGRLVKGELVQSHPGYNHSFGPPVKELLHIGEEEKSILNNQ